MPVPTPAVPADTADAEPSPADAPDPAVGPDEDPEQVGRLERIFGPMTAVRVVALVVAFAFLGAVLGYVGGQDRSDHPLSTVDVGFFRDMSFHHEQAVGMSVLLLAKSGIQGDLRGYATEIILDQRYEIGVMNATLDRFGYPSSPGRTGMGWMGPAYPINEMPGLATPAQMAALKHDTGRTAEALWIALMSEHHLGGMHMADDAYRKGHDRTVRNVAYGDLTTQRGEIVDLSILRKRLGLPIPKGFTDPTKDPRIHPLALQQG